MTAWEYRVVEIVVHDLRRCEMIMNDLGREGWELISVMPPDPAQERPLPLAFFKEPEWRPPE
jgi:hypothetical protein